MPTLILYYLLVLCALSSDLSFAASFNCNKATTKVEQIICGDTSLNIKDSYMSLLYAKLADTDTAPDKALQFSQKNWLERRNNCTTQLCLIHAYDQRIATLQAASGPSSGLSSFSLKGKWTADYSSQTASSLLEITTVDKNGFKYKIEAQNGDHTGKIEERAFFMGNDALTIDNSVIDGESFDSPCILLFQAYGNQLRVYQNYACGYFAGQGVSFAGNYVAQVHAKTN